MIPLQLFAELCKMYNEKKTQDMMRNPGRRLMFASSRNYGDLTMQLHMVTSEFCLVFWFEKDVMFLYFSYLWVYYFKKSKARWSEAGTLKSCISKRVKTRGG